MRTLAVVLLGAALTSAQALPSFEVTSVKRNVSGDPPGPIGFMPPTTGNFNARNRTVFDLVRNAYGMRESQVVGGPDWIRSERYDVAARATGTFPPDVSHEGVPRGPSRQLFLMLRSLLADRFHVKAHVEPREMPVYHLALARTDGRLGPGLRRSAADCAAVLAEMKAGGTPSLVKAGCFIFGSGPPGATNRGRMEGRGLHIQHLTSGPLADFADRPVIDRTGLTGYYDIDLEWTPDPGAATPDVPPSLFTALQEQLGLKLEPGRAQVDVLVIEHVERPAPD